MVTELENFRKKFPEYSDIDDVTLAQKLASKYPEYSDLPGKVGTVASEPTTEKPEQSFISKTVSNIPSSGYDFLKNLITPFISPVQTAKGLAYSGLGLAEKLVPGEQEHEKYIDEIIKFFADRYGGLENIKNTISKDPVGFAADLSSVLSGAGMGLKATGIAGQAGQVLSKAGKVTEPLNLAGKMVSPLASPVKRGVQELLGATTGVGGESIRRAMKGTSEFAEGMRGKVGGEEVLAEAKGALQAIKDQRGVEYRQQLQQISKINQDLDITPVHQKINQLKQSYNIKVNNKGEFDFSRSTLDRNAQADVKALLETVNDWGSQTGDLTPTGLDILKRKLDDFYSPSKNSRALVESLRNEVKKVIVDNVPEYQEMTSGYAKASGVIEQTQKALSMGDKASVDMAIRKLMSTMRDDNQFRRDLVQNLEKVGGKEILDQVAGLQMTGFTPKSWLGRSMGATEIFSALLGRPEMLAGLATASPRVVGEFMNTLGRAINEYQKVGKAMTPARQGAYQIGRLPFEEQQPQWRTPGLEDYLMTGGQ
jgi:flagellar biosynthesis chaperone FliJ